jgi:hypothetical protein
MLVWYGIPYLWVNHWLGKFYNYIVCPSRNS